MYTFAFVSALELHSGPKLDIPSILIICYVLFRTYENPKEFTGSCGFDDEKEQSLLTMLQFKDIHT